MDINKLISENKNIKLIAEREAISEKRIPKSKIYHLLQDNEPSIILAKILVKGTKTIRIKFTEDSYVSHVENVIKAILKGK